MLAYAVRFIHSCKEKTLKPRAFLLAPLTLLPLAFAACGVKELPITPLDDVCETGEYGKAIRTAGYLYGPGTMMSCDGVTCEMMISNTRAGGNTSLRIDIRIGSGNNSMDEPDDSFNEADLVVRDDLGDSHRIGDWIVVQGRLLNEQACLMTPVSRVYPGAAPLAAAPPIEPPPPTAAPAPSSVPAVPSPSVGAPPAPTGDGAKPPTVVPDSEGKP
jgi:hypothetical protein